MPATLTTHRLTLRAFEESDADAVLDLYSRWEVQRFLGRSPRVLESREEAAAKISIWRSLEHPVHGIWAVTLASRPSAPVGTLLLKSLPSSGEEPLQPSGATEIGWHFHPDHWGNGYASEAATRVLAHAFASGLDEVLAVTAPENIASQAVATRIGMLPRGATEDYYNVRSELFRAERSSPVAPR